MSSLNNQTVGEAIGYEMILAVLFASQDCIKPESLSEISQSLIHTNMFDAVESMESDEKQAIIDAAQGVVERVKNLASAIRTATGKQGD